MLVMNGERFGGLPRDGPWATGDVQQPPPADRRVSVLPRPAQRYRQRAQAVDLESRHRAVRRRAICHVHGAAERIARTRIEPGARVQVAERERFARVASVVRAVPRQVQQPRGQRCQRQQIESVVLDHRDERTRIAGTDELEVARWDCEPRDVADAPCADNLPLQGDQRTDRVAGSGRPEGLRHGRLGALGRAVAAQPITSALARLPESPCRMENVHVGQPPADPVQPVKQTARFEERRIE